MENAGNGCGAAPKLCPSAQPGMDNCRVLGVVQHDTPQPMLLYLKEPVAATPDVLAMAAPLRPTEVFRLSATCATHKCPHFDGADCQLATRIVRCGRRQWTRCRLASFARTADGSRKRAVRRVFDVLRSRP